MSVKSKIKDAMDEMGKSEARKKIHPDLHKPGERWLIEDDDGVLEGTISGYSPSAGYVKIKWADGSENWHALDLVMVERLG